MNVALFIIDPQVDFCDPECGALSVTGAKADIARLAAMVRRLADRIDRIHVTLDSHHTVHIAHPIFWTNSEGGHPAPFTWISVNDVESGRWTAARPELRPRALEYVRSLEAGGRCRLCIWPPHCLIGSAGHAVMPGHRRRCSRWGCTVSIDQYQVITEAYSPRILRSWTIACRAR